MSDHCYACGVSLRLPAVYMQAMPAWAEPI